MITNNNKDMSREKRMVQIITPSKQGESLVSEKVGRNSVCLCDSGKKAKRCCGNDTKYYSK